MQQNHSNLNAPCGLYCGVCRIYMATVENDLAYLKRLGKLYARQFPQIAALSSEELQCDGCLSVRRFPSCQVCSIRDCVQSKGIEGCHVCADFPCRHIDEFPIPAGKKAILRAVPYWRENGTQAWIQSEKERYHCPTCGERLYRGVKQCPACRSVVDLDG
jgi:hypothetical protein